eukprot:TRINITY_DN11775_c0_g1_i1.p1 TRINITY_DN11775_c0_g1~~TRINITY_DN11775_c0_g1_i1.p1  ORF type:complete len:753 (-),score=139.75 TRINITY_DN11775_c0_g1_i1:40-2298(-)
MSEPWRTRWLKAPELVEILSLRNPCLPWSTAPPVRPASGEIFLYDKTATKDFRKDGHEWKRRNNSLSVRENHERLKIDGVERVNCGYTHNDNGFQRRIYSLVDPGSTTVLVHYLRPAPPTADQESLVLGLPLPAEAEAEQAQTQQATPAPLPLWFLSDFPAAETPFPEGPSPPFLFTPELPPQPAQQHLQQQFPQPLSIGDYTPSWDYCAGGAKVLFTAAWLLPGRVYSVKFGETQVVAELTCHGVLRCFAPPSQAPKTISISIVGSAYNGHDITPYITSEQLLFHYRPNSGETTAPAPAAQTPVPPSQRSPAAAPQQPLRSNKRTLSQTESSLPVQWMDRDLRPRMMRRLQYLPKKIELPQQLGATNCETLVSVVGAILAATLSAAEKRNLLQSVDDSGFSLLHYAAVLGAPGVLVDAAQQTAVDINQRDQHGTTLLHWAAATGNLAVVETLVDKLSANPSVKDFGNVLPIEMAMANKHDDVALFLAEHNVESVQLDEAHPAAAAAAPTISVAMLPATARGRLSKLRPQLDALAPPGLPWDSSSSASSRSPSPSPSESRSESPFAQHVPNPKRARIHQASAAAAPATATAAAAPEVAPTAPSTTAAEAAAAKIQQAFRHHKIRQRQSGSRAWWERRRNAASAKVQEAYRTHTMRAMLMDHRDADNDADHTLEDRTATRAELAALRIQRAYRTFRQQHTVPEDHPAQPGNESPAPGDESRQNQGEDSGPRTEAAFRIQRLYRLHRLRRAKPR